MRKYTVVVIGSGAGLPLLLEALQKLEHKVLVVDEFKRQPTPFVLKAHPIIEEMIVEKSNPIIERRKIQKLHKDSKTQKLCSYAKKITNRKFVKRY